MISPSFEAYSRLEPDTEDKDGRGAVSKQRRSTSFEVRSQLVPETEEDDDYGVGFKELLIEARETFTRKDPDFVINDKGVETRTVQIANDKLAELVFQYWDDRRGKAASIMPDLGLKPGMRRARLRGKRAARLKRL